MATQSDFFEAKGSAFPTGAVLLHAIARRGDQGPPGMLGGTGEERTARRWRPAEERLPHLPQLKAGRLRRQKGSMLKSALPGAASKAPASNAADSSADTSLCYYTPQGRAMSMNNRPRRQSGPVHDRTTGGPRHQQLP